MESQPARIQLDSVHDFHFLLQQFQKTVRDAIGSGLLQSQIEQVISERASPVSVEEVEIEVQQRIDRWVTQLFEMAAANISIAGGDVHDALDDPVGTKY
jgi:uncharacterized membrane-anchored protein